MYHIPILLWLDQNHPMIAPLCFVDPTQGENMRVTSSLNVLSTGQIVNHACIDQWSPGGGLYILVTQLVSMFAHASPVHSVAAPAPAPQPQYGQPQPQYGQPQSQPQPHYRQPQPHYGQQYAAAANPYPFGPGPGAASAQHAGHGGGGSTGYNPQPFGAGVQGGGGGAGRDYHQPQQDYRQPQHQAAPAWTPPAATETKAHRAVSEPLSAQIVRDSAVGCAQDKLLRQLNSKHQLSTTEIVKAQNVSLSMFPAIAVVVLLPA